MARRGQSAPVGSDPLWYKDAVIYEVHVARVLRQRRRRHRRLSRPDAEARLSGQTWASRRSGCCRSIRRRCRDDGYDIADYTDVNPAYGTLRDFKAASFARPTRAACASSPSWCSTTPPISIPGFSAPAARRPAAPERDFYVWSDDPDKYQDARIIFKDFERSNWTWDPVAKAYYWHRFYAHQPDLNFDNPRVQTGDHARRSTSGSTWASTACGSTRCRICTSARARTARTCRRRTPFCSELRAHIDAKYPATACCWPRPTSGPRMRSPTSATATSATWRFTFRSCRGMFMAMHMEDRFPIVDILRADAGDPRQLPVGALPAQPRRADAGDGHRRGTRLHVPRLRPRPAEPHQPGHSPPAGAAAGQQSRRDRADERPALLAARHARDLLRRRDRHGRQHLPGRSQRRAHADAVERRPQRRLRAANPQQLCSCRSSSIRSTTTKRSTSRRSRTTRSRCCGG